MGILLNISMFLLPSLFLYMVHMGTANRMGGVQQSQKMVDFLAISAFH